jgi:hypothetical protein
MGSLADGHTVWRLVAPTASAITTSPARSLWSPTASAAGRWSRQPTCLAIGSRPVADDEVLRLSSPLTVSCSCSRGLYPPSAVQPPGSLRSPQPMQVNSVLACRHTEVVIECRSMRPAHTLLASSASRAQSCRAGRVARRRAARRARGNATWLASHPSLCRCRQEWGRPLPSTEGLVCLQGRRGIARRTRAEMGRPEIR